MATTTENLGLTLPAGTDRAEISVLNENFQTLDTFAGQATADIQEAQETANAAAPQATTYTKDEVDAAIEEAIEHGGGGTTDYTDLTNKPSINGVVLTGNKTTSDLGIEENVQADWDEADTTAPSYIKNKPNIPAGVVVDTTYDGTSENAQAGTAVAQAISTKVDKVTGKGLSTNDFTNADKTKLDGIESGAEANVQADWTQTDTTADDYIKNKPTIPAPVTVDQTYSATSANAQSGVAVAQAISTKVDKATGKGLSTNDFTNTDKANLETALTKANAAAPQSTTYTKTEVDTALAEKISHEFAVPTNSIFEYANSLPVGFYTARQGYGTGSDKPVANEGYAYLISIFTSSTAQITAFTAIKEAAIAVPSIYTAVKSNGTWGPWYKFEGTAVT